MIDGIFETHLNVRDLEKSVHFYNDILGLTLAYTQPERNRAFFWVGGEGKAMLGLWQKESSQVLRQHFAFQVSLQNMRKAVSYLQEKGIQTHNFLNDDSAELYVFGWMPAVSVYFTDPDGHTLEFISMLPDRPRSDLGMVPWNTWEQLQGRA
ncbi:VOC family protein [Paenibacillus massiliensis]|uniref:VOC family protein n=1 Tax=Paenibacillus massiliensis TaxID=225917 RepID=UPI000380CDE8|nr:VOC family protein [Paenibacillus massiliensis]